MLVTDLTDIVNAPLFKIDFDNGSGMEDCDQIHNMFVSSIPEYDCLVKNRSYLVVDYEYVVALKILFGHL